MTRTLSIHLIAMMALMGTIGLERAAAVPLSGIVLPDANLQACVTNAAADNGWVDTIQVVTLICEGAGISNLAGIDSLSNLTHLILRRNQISNVSPLGSLANLDLGFNPISDVSALAGLTALTNLSLRSNQISDVSPLVGLTGLTQLNLSANPIADVSPLAGLINLMSLDLRGTISYRM